MRLVAIHTYPIKGIRRVEQHTAAVRPWGLAGDRRWMIVDGNGVGVTQRETSALVGIRAERVPGGLVLHHDSRPPLVVAEPTAGPRLDVRVFRSREPVPARDAGAAAADWLTLVLDRPVRLVWLDDPTNRLVRPTDVYAPGVEAGGPVSFADSLPLLLVNLASLAALDELLRADGVETGPLPVTRFRPNLVIDGAAPWAEDAWPGRRLQIGATVLRATGGCGRCVVTTVDQETGRRGSEPLRALGAHRNRDGRLIFGLHMQPELTDPAGPPPVITVGDPVRLLPD
jgi:uncharacterized protein YcbX